MADGTFKMTLPEGCEVEVWEDIEDGESVAVLFVQSVFQTLGEQIRLVGVAIELPDGQDYVVTANCRLNGEQAGALIEALRAAIHEGRVCKKCGSRNARVRYHRDAVDCPALERKHRTEGEHLHYTCLDCEFDWTGAVAEPEPEGESP